MPWRRTTVMEERFGFVTRRLEGESMSALCREFGISRKTGHKIFARYREHGLEELHDQSRRPRRNANRLPLPVEAQIVALKREKPHWGARKLRELLAKRLGPDVRLPVRSTIHAVLDRHGLVEHARARRPRATGTPLSQPAAQNDHRSHRLQGRVPARQPALVLSAHRHRPARALSLDGRGARVHPRSSGFHGILPSVRGARPAGGDPLGRRTGGSPVAKRHTVRQPWALRPRAAFGLVAAARHPDRAHHAGAPPRDTVPTSACTSR